MEILYFTEDVDEFAAKILGKYKDKEFKSVSDADAGETPENTEENKDVFEFLTKALEGKVKEVKASAKLKTHPVCLSSAGPLSLEMEKVLNAMPNDQKVKAERVLEINTNHKMFEKIKALYAADQEKLKKLAVVLYDIALLIEGMNIDSPTDFAETLCELLDE